MWWRDHRLSGGGTGPQDPVVLHRERSWAARVLDGAGHWHQASTCWRWHDGVTVQGRLWCRCGAERTGQRWQQVNERPPHAGDTANVGVGEAVGS